MIFVDVADQVASVAERARKCPDPVLRRAYVGAMRTWCRETRWLRADVSGATVAGTALYALGEDVNLEIVGVAAVRGSATTVAGTTYWPLAVGDSAYWAPDAAQGKPVCYVYVPEGQVALHPTPDAAYATLISAVVQPKDTATQVPAQLMAKWSEVFDAGALADLLAMQGTSWFDPRAAAGNAATFRAGVSNAKADVQRGYNAGSQRVLPRRFLI